MGLLRKALHIGDLARGWRLVKPREGVAGPLWFIKRFATAAEVVVRKWGPRWSRRREVFGRPLGAWLLLIVWLGVPMGLVVRRVAFLFR